ncbi:MAG: dephospho-CoA kinase [Syntrophales bacterium]|nr:dephospho-CoA kinase [Syntrophales bacterium]
MLKVGLTGGIASGKTTIARLLVEKGAYHIDFDELAHDVEKKGTPVWEQIVRNFGPGILLEDGTIDRRKLAQIVFKNKEKLNQLNQIVHPAVLEKWYKCLKDIADQNAQAIVLNDVPLLFEVGLQGLFDHIILIYSPPDIQIKRLMERNGYTEEEAKQRLAAQMSMEEKVPLADTVFDNSLPLEEAKTRVDILWEKLTRLQKDKYLERRNST